MTQLTLTTKTPRETQRGPHSGPVAANDERTRLQLLVGELLSENQKLRFENESLRAGVEKLQRQAESAERGLADATKWAGMLF